MGCGEREGDSGSLEPREGLGGSLSGEEAAVKGSAPFLAEAMAKAALRAGLPEPSGFAPRPDRCWALPRQTSLYSTTAYTASNTLEPQTRPQGALSPPAPAQLLDRLPCCECLQGVYRKLITVNRSANIF